MKLFAAAIAATTALAFAGCAQVDQFETFVTSSKTQATVAVLAKATVVVLCDISAVAQVTNEVGQAVNADKSFLGTTNKIYAGSSTACTGLGGLVQGMVSAPAGAAVVQ